MSQNHIKREQALCNYVCGKYYFIEYRCHDYTYSAEGLLENYYGGDVVLLAKDGIYNIKYKDIVFMKPIKIPSLDKFNKEYQELLIELQKE